MHFNEDERDERDEMEEPEQETQDETEGDAPYDDSEMDEGKLETVAWEAMNTAKEILTHFPKIPDPDVSSRVEEGSIWVEIEGDPTGRLIGRRGNTIDAFQHILSKIMSHRLRKKITIHVDAEGYKARQREKIMGLAKDTADYVAATGSARALEPMSPADRRFVHIALRERDDVLTASEGEGENRFVVIWPNIDEDEE